MGRKKLLSDRYKATDSKAMTAQSGLPMYADLFAASGLLDATREVVRYRGRGWDDGMCLLTLVLLNLAGGEHVSDVEKLAEDGVLTRALERARFRGLPRAERRKIRRKREELEGRGEGARGIPSSSSLLRWLYAFHDGEAVERARRAAKLAGLKSFVPEETAGLLGLRELNKRLLSFLQERQGEETATLDMDATCVASEKSSARFCYKRFRGYQPLSVYWHEQDVVVTSQFRDGNVPAHSRQLEVFQRALAMLPAGVKRVFLRCDKAGYLWPLLHYCAEGKNERFGRIDFAVGADLTPKLTEKIQKLKPEAWRPLKRFVRGKEKDPIHDYAEVVFVPNEAARKKDGPTYRYIVTRKRVCEHRRAVQIPLPGMDDGKGEMRLKDGDEQVLYKVYAICTTLEGPADEIIRWHRKRCGASEQAHTTMKRDLAGGILPTDRFGANAAWWGIMVLAFNLHVAMKRLVLRGEWVKRELKSIRYHFIRGAGRLVRTAGSWWVSVAREAYELLSSAQARILALADVAADAAPG